MANQNAQTVYATLTQQGMPAAGAAGIVANLAAESGVVPNGPAGDGGTSHGMAQWHLGRWDALLAFAKKGGADPNALATQTAFLIQEAKGIPYGKGSLWDAMRQQTDPLQATALWMRQFERPLDQSNAAALDRYNKGKAALAGLNPTGQGLDLSKLPGVGAVTGAVSGAVGAATDALSAITAPFQGIGSFFDHLLWWFNPTHQIRVGVGTIGIVLMLIGVVLLSREVRT